MSTITTTTGTSTSTSADIVIQIDTIYQLFNAPEVNPFSDKAVDVLGESAMTRITRRLLTRPVHNWDGARLVIQLPSDQITPDLQRKTTEAVCRYIDAKIEDNRLTIRLTLLLGLISLLIVMVVATVVVTLTTVLLAGPLVNIDEDFRGLIAAFVGILGWVMLWDPLSKLLFEWVGPWLKSNTLRRVKAMLIVIEPQNER